MLFAERHRDQKELRRRLQRGADRFERPKLGRLGLLGQTSEDRAERTAPSMVTAKPSKLLVFAAKIDAHWH